MRSGFCLAASCLDWGRQKPLCAGAGEGAAVRDRRVQAPPSGNSRPSLQKPLPVGRLCSHTRLRARTHPQKGQLEGQIPVQKLCSSWADPTAQPLHSAPRWCSTSCAFLHPAWGAAPSPNWASGLEVKGTIWSKLFTGICTHPPEDQKWLSTSKAFQGRVMLHKQTWTFPPMFNLCLLSPWGSNSKKMTLKGYDFLLHTKLVILGLLFLFPLFYSLSPLPSPEQKRSYISSGSVFTGDSFFSFFWQLSFHKEKKYISFFFSI